MVALLIGYARVSTDQQDLMAQRDGLDALGVSANRVYVDQGLTGTNRERPGLREALAACREGDTLMVTKLDRLARSLPDARAIANELTQRQVRLNLDGSVYDPNDPVGRLLLNVLAMVAEALGVQDERSLPLWVADPGWRGFNANDSSKARRGGLITRPLDQTLADTLAWEWSRERAHVRQAGLSDEERASPARGSGTRLTPPPADQPPRAALRSLDGACRGRNRPR